jgi:hypothetical protein
MVPETDCTSLYFHGTDWVLLLVYTNFEERIYYKLI